MNASENRAPLVVGIIGTLVAIGAGSVAWTTNDQFAEDGEAFAALLAAIFSMVTTVWLIMTVWLQRAELNLQREELALQRRESQRIADETHRQADLFSYQLVIYFRQDLVYQMRALLGQEASLYTRFVNDIKRKIRETLAERMGRKPNFQEDMRAAIFQNHIEASTDSISPSKIDYQEIACRFDREKELHELQQLVEVYQSCKNMGSDKWFRMSLPTSIGAVGSAHHSLNVIDIKLMLLVAAEYAVQA